jgi:hypothetical protein
MKPAQLPAAVMAKLLVLDQVASEFAAIAQAAERRLAHARDVINGRREVDVEDYQRERDGFDAVFATAKMAASYAESARRVLTQCRAWLDSLPADSKLLLVSPAASDFELTALQARLADMRAELSKLQSTPVPADDVADKIHTYFSDLACSGVPVVRGFEAGAQFQVFWPGYGAAGARNLNGYDTQSANALLMAALLQPQALADAIMRSVESTQPMPKAQLEVRCAELERGIDELSYIVATALEQAGAPPDAKMEARHVLGVRVDAEATQEGVAA